MKLNIRIFVFLMVVFILFVSFKILEPEIEEHHGRDIRDGQDYVMGGEDSLEKINTPKGLPASPKTIYEYNATQQVVIKRLLEKYSVDFTYKLKHSPWKIAQKWVKSREITPDFAPEIGKSL